MTLFRRHASQAYWVAQRMLRTWIGSRVEERFFRRRALAEVRDGFSNLTLPHREWLIRRLSEGIDLDQPAHIVEVGSGWGPNLVVLASRSSRARLTGVDISPASIAAGRDKVSELGLRNIMLMEGEASDLAAFESASADVVFTDAALLYVGPDKIERSLQELVRISRGRVLLLEMQESGAGARGHFTRDGWVRDYVALSRALFPGAEVSFERLPPALRPAGRWPEFGALVAIDVGSKALSR